MGGEAAESAGAGKAPDPVEPDWPAIFIVLSEEFGWSFDDIGRMSLRDVDIAMDILSRRMKSRAAILDAPKTSAAEPSPQDLTDREKKFIKEQQDQILAGNAKEYAKTWKI